jgi:hypothetical protein
MRLLFFLSSLFLSTFSVAEELPTYVPEYDRASWNHWIDIDGDCQNARHELLIEKSSVPVTFTNKKKCSVNTGKWVGPYTGVTFTKASDVDIDHVVPLAEAHRSGGWRWSWTLKQVFANDPENLLITEDNANQAKSDKDPAQWFDVQPSYQCEYLRKWVSIKGRYNLRMDGVEKSFIEAKLESC